MAGVESAVRMHVDRGDDLNARDARGMTPLMLSALRDKPAICELLLSAGADPGLLDSSGRTALQIAIAVGSEAIVAILDTISVPISALPASGIALDPESLPELASGAFPSVDFAAEAVASVKPEASTTPTEAETPVELFAQEPSPLLADMDEGEFDLSDWTAEEEPKRPEVDLVVVASASAVQIAITAHEPVDSSADWNDIDVYLPEVGLPLARADDVESRAKLRLLLLRAIREGSVPELDVQAQATNEDRSANPEAEACLVMVINDLGAEVDERFEYSSVNESFKVFVDPEETPDEEAAVDEALAAIDRAASPRHEPLRIYQREFQGLQLLTAEEEVQLAKDMETALEAALDALASWPDGIARTLAAGAEAVAGLRRLSSVWIGSEPDLEHALDESVEADTQAPVEYEDDTAKDRELGDQLPATTGEAVFAATLMRVTTLVDREDGPGASFQEIRQALAALRLNRRFLLELIDAANGPAPCLAFQGAMTNFRKARDRMAGANLKLAFFHAKKYLRSGEPLDDLAQEGNIGLLTAVDRYDWRRGFRFSTYATWWIRQQISRYVADKARTIRVPAHVHEKLQRARRLTEDFEKSVGHEPTFDELAQRMEMPLHKLADLLRIAPEPSSIDQSTVDGMIAIDARDVYVSPDPEDVVDKIHLNRVVDRYISLLSTKDRKGELVLRLRFGIGVDEVLTLDEVGKRFQITRERVRQIEAKALRKLQACMVLGWESQKPPLSPSAQAPDCDDESYAAEATPSPAVSKRQAAARSPRKPIQRADSSEPTALNRVLARATELGAAVEDGRGTAVERIWVNLEATHDASRRKLARKLIEFGFKHSPGKGFWK